MAGFLYYAPGRQQPITTAAAVDEALESLSIGYLGRDGLQSRVVLNGGPDGGAGLIFALGNVDRLGYYPDAQRWERRPDGAVWLGWEIAAAPGPGDLARETQLAGLGLRLGDGNVWQIPVAQHWDGQSQLPSVYRLVDGNVVPEVLPGLRAFQDEVEAFLTAWRSALEEGRAPSYAEEQLFDLAGHALQLNYRMGRWEVLALGLLQSQRYGERAGVWEVCTATFNWPAVETALREFAKKNELEARGDCGGEE